MRISTPYDAQSGTELDALTAAHPGVVAWFIAGRMLKRRTLQPQDIRLFERSGARWISRLERRWEPPLGQSLVAVARRHTT